MSTIMRRKPFGFLIGLNLFFSISLGAQNFLSPASQLTTPGDILFWPVTGDVKILMVRIKYPGNASSILSNTEAQAHADIVKRSLETNSYDAANVQIDITPILTMPNSESFYQSAAKLRTDAVRLAEQAGFLNADYDREIIITKKIWPGGGGAKGQINMRTAVVSFDRPYVSVHELGHVFSWRHTNFWHVTAGSPIAPNGTLIEYGDKFDMMGGSAGPPPYANRIYHHFNPWLKQRAGWLPQSSVLTVTQPGTYRIEALESAPIQGKYTALKIRKSGMEDYWIYYRTEEGFVGDGPVISKIFNNNIMPSWLLDMTPGSIPNSGNQVLDWQDAALGVGESFVDSQLGVEIKTIERQDNWVEVEIEGAPPPVSSVPVIDVIAPLRGDTKFGSVAYEVTAYDPDIGNSNGAGIAKVILWLHRFGDDVIINLRNGLDPPSPVATKELVSPDYRWVFDTVNDPAGPLDRAIYFLVIRAISTENDTNTVWFEHFVDNVYPLAAAPALSTPADLAAGIETPPELSWNAVPGANSYRLQVATDSDFTSEVFDQWGLTITTVQIMGLSNQTSYYWRVNATNSNGTGAWSGPRRFTTVVSPPSAPTLISPLDNATDVDRMPSVTWNSVAEADFYRLQISADLNFTNIVFDADNISDTSVQAAGLQDNTIFFWRVSASNSVGAGPWSQVWSFRTEAESLAAPALVAPADGAVDNSLNPTLSWHPIPNADSYRLQVSKESNFVTLIVDQSGISDSTWQGVDLEGETVYYWRVKALNSTGESDWSEVWNFMTEVITLIEQLHEAIPSGYKLGQNFPNPFNPSTTIEFDLPRAGFATLTVYNMVGQKVSVLVAKHLSAGKYRVRLDGDKLSSGIYLYRLRAGEFVNSKKMLLDK